MPPFPLFVSSRHRVYHREDKSGFVIERNARQSFLFVADPSVRIWRFILPQPPEPVSSGTEDPSNRCKWRAYNATATTTKTYTAQQNHLRPTPPTVEELSLSPLLPTPLPSTMFLSVTVYRISKLKRMARLVALIKNPIFQGFVFSVLQSYLWKNWINDAHREENERWKLHAFLYESYCSFCRLIGEIKMYLYDISMKFWTFEKFVERVYVFISNYGVIRAKERESEAKERKRKKLPTITPTRVYWKKKTDPTLSYIIPYEYKVRSSRKDETTRFKSSQHRVPQWFLNS